MEHDEIKSQLYTLFSRVGKAVSSPARLEILDLLSQSERSVEELARAASLTIGNTSAHLKVLHTAGLVSRRREGQRVYYRLASPEVFRFLRHLETLGNNQLAEVDRLVRLHYQAPDELEPVTSEELLRRVHSADIVVLDVRPPEEYRAGHLPRAINLPPDQVERRLDELPRDKEIVAYCRGPYCLFSVEATAALSERGLRVRRMAEGFPDWRDAGYPVETGAGR